MVQWYSLGDANVHPPNTCFLQPTLVQIPNVISIGSAVFAQVVAESRYTLQQAALSPLKLHNLGQSVPVLYSGPPFPPPSKLPICMQEI